jgi:branched-chain amino acid transport system ATP-binding protein
MPLLELKNISLVFGGIKVLISVTFSLEKGQIIALIGLNGVGKTSVLNGINGPYYPNSGSLRYRGEDIFCL